VGVSVFSRRETIVLAVLFVSFLVLSIALAPIQAATDPADPRLTTWRTSPNGARAAYLTLEQLGIPVGRAGRSFAVAAPTGAPLAILAPGRILLEEELAALMSWLRNGGELLYVPSTLGRRILQPEILDSLGLRGVFLADSLRPTVALPHRWTDGLGSLPPSSWALSPAVNAGAPGPNLVVVSDSLAGIVGPPVGDAGASASTSVVMSDSLPVLVERRVGEGRAIVWTQGAWLRNVRLRDQADPMSLLARIAQELTASGNTLYFDEYHHGFQEGGGPVRTSLRFFGSTPLGRATLHLGVVGLLALLVAGARFGAPRAAPHPTRRSPMEHVQALAQAYRRAKAEDRLARLTLIGLARRLKHRAPPEDPGDTPHWISALPVPSGSRNRILDAWNSEPGPRLARLADAIDLTLSEGRGM